MIFLTQEKRKPHIHGELLDIGVGESFYEKYRKKIVYCKKFGILRTFSYIYYVNN